MQAHRFAFALTALALAMGCSDAANPTASDDEDYQLDGPFQDTEPVGKVVRFATPDDISEEQHLKAITAEEIQSCAQIAKELNLRM
ncbi:MAG TPA: PSP1 C-terminal domain-containing protein, partial [Polyangiaceae bacterium]|nr:PSP1 C-terminal domain-containing protein [Polyangiaceae bacterium]